MAPTKTVEAQVVLSLGDRLTAGLNRIQARINKLTTGLGLQRLTSSLGNLGSKLGNLGPALTQSVGRLGIFTAALGVGGAGAIAGTIELANRAQALGDEIAKTSRQLGFGAEALQEYRYVAEMQGVSVEKFEASLGIFNRRLGEAANGNKAYLRFFQDLGIRIRDANGNIRETDAIFTDAATAIASLKTPAERSAAAMNLFGRSGMDMTRVFEAGADGIASLRQEARTTGHVMSQAAAEFSEIYGDNVARLQKRFEGLQTMIGVQLMPVLNDLVTQATAWFDANQKLIRSTITEWVGKLAELLKQLADPTSELRTGFADLVGKVTGFYNAISPIVDLMGGPGMAVFFGLAAYISAPLVAAFAALAPVIWSVGVALATTPIGWIIGGLVLMGAAVYVLTQKWDEFLAYWGGLWDRIKAGFDKGFVVGILTALNEFNPVTHIARGMDAVLEYFTGFSLLEAGTAVMVSFANGLEAAFENVLTWAGNVGGAIVDAILAGITEGWSQLTGFFDAKIAELTSALPDWIKGPLGITVSAATPQASAAPGMGVGASTPSTSGTVADPWGYNLPVPAAPAIPAAPSVPSAVPEVNTQQVEAGAVNAATLNVPDPIIANQPQNVNANQTVNLTVNVQGMTQAEAQATVRRALQQASNDQAAAVTSALND